MYNQILDNSCSFEQIIKKNCAIDAWVCLRPPESSFVPLIPPLHSHFLGREGKHETIPHPFPRGNEIALQVGKAVCTC